MPFVVPAQVARTFAPATDRCRDASGMRARPECVVLGVAEGVTPSAKPPVRIFLGTEPAQYRAERVFVWSIERVRDPSRVYEIHLMKELAGFNRRRWLTGFTNYRFAIPHFAGGAGRAIWNDVDQAYLADPAELFDTEMGDHGFLAIAPGGRADSAVMLIDCARMAPVWTLEGARHRHKNALLAKALAVPGLRGDLAPEWHARDEEYVPGHSKLLHWTILHTQPWRPLPGLFAYQRNPVGRIWHELERSADAAGYSVFTATRPSAQYARRVRRLRAAPGSRGAPGVLAPLRDLATKAEARTVLDYGFATNENGLDLADLADLAIAVSHLDRAAASPAAPPSERFDGVACIAGLDFVPDEDVPWVVGEMFALARRFVFARLSERALTRTAPDGTRIESRPRARAWWREHFRAIAAHHPDLHWELVWAAPGTDVREPIHVHRAGCCLGDLPTVCVLADQRPEYASQAAALADALGWPYEIAETTDGPPPSWPDLVIAAGDGAARAARSIAEKTRGRARLVRLDGGTGGIGERFDAAIVPAYYRLPPHPQRIETATRLSRVTPEGLARASGHWPTLFGEAPRPRIVLLIGDPTAPFRLDAGAVRRLGEDVRTFAETAEGSVFAFTGPRLGEKATGALVTGLGEASHLHWWRPRSRDDDLYLAFLAGADAIVVSGESETMLADAVATGKPVYIYPPPERRSGLIRRIEEAVLARSQARPLNRRGTVRPQQGREYLCARLIERGIVHPPRDLNALHQTLIRLGVARFFGAALEPGWNGPPRHEAAEAAAKLRALLGLVAP